MELRPLHIHCSNFTWLQTGFLLVRLFLRDFLGGRFGYVHVKELVKTALTGLICSFEIV